MLENLESLGEHLCLPVGNFTGISDLTACPFGRSVSDCGYPYITAAGGDAAYAATPVRVRGALYAVTFFRLTLGHADGET